MDIDSYLERIRYSGARTPTSHTLQDLQVRHLLSVPFENLDIHLGRAITLRERDLYDKVVTAGRGGFCYELNGLFAWLLRALGFGVTYLSARDAREDGSFGPDFDHLALHVQVPLESRGSSKGRIPTRVDDPGWLADVGWGDTFREPLRLLPGRLQVQGARAFRIEDCGDSYLLWQRMEAGDWKRDFSFRPQPQRLSDFEPMCAFQQSSPESRWTQERLCTIATPGGRVTLKDSQLRIRRGAELTERWVSDVTEYSAALRKYFGIHLPLDFCARLM